MRQSILITGCSSGIGYYCAKALHEQGYLVFASARDEADVARLQEEGLRALKLDLRDSKSMQSALESILLETNGRLDYLFNNGAYGQPGAVEDLQREVLREQFETNVFGTQELTNMVLPIMRQQGHGRIIHNSSVLGFISMSYRGAYNASKYALEGLTDTLRLELQGTNIHVCLIEPGPIRSDFRKNALKMFLKNIQTQGSAHEKVYEKTLTRLQKEGDAAPFTLGPDAVFKTLEHALKAKIPKARYRVTFPTKLFWFLKRILSTKLLDAIIAKAE